MRIVTVSAVCGAAVFLGLISACVPTPPWTAALTGPLAFVPEYAGAVIPNTLGSGDPDLSTVQVLLFNVDVSYDCDAYVDGGWVGGVGNELSVTMSSADGSPLAPGSFQVQGGPSTDGGSETGNYVHALNELPSGDTFDSVSVSGAIALTQSSVAYAGSFDVTLPDPNSADGTSRLQGTFSAPPCSQLIANYLWIP